jgi:putative endonuclease
VNWSVYIILCSDDTLYTGITTDVERRMRQHASGQGAKYFRGRQPRELLYLEGGHDRSTASKREIEIKSMRRSDKELLARAAGVRTEDRFFVATSLTPSPSPAGRGEV